MRNRCREANCLLYWCLIGEGKKTPKNILSLIPGILHYIPRPEVQQGLLCVTHCHLIYCGHSNGSQLSKQNYWFEQLINEPHSQVKCPTMGVAIVSIFPRFTSGVFLYDCLTYCHIKASFWLFMCLSMSKLCNQRCIMFSVMTNILGIWWHNLIAKMFHFCTPLPPKAEDSEIQRH